MPEDWLLYVDESGDDHNPDDVHLVGGLLLQANDSTGLDRLLRRALEDVYPLWPWPPHATELRFVSARVAAAMRSTSAEESERAERLREKTDPLVQLTRASREEPARALCELAADWKAGTRRYEVLRDADRWLRKQDRGAFEALRRECEAQERRLQQYLAALGRVGVARATVLLTVSPRYEPDVPADGLPATPRCQVRRNRYVRALEALLTSATELLAGDGGTIRLYAATRRVARTPTPKGRADSVDLFPHVVADIADSGRSGLPRPTAAPELLPLGNPNSYDEAVVPGIVFADWIVNRARRALREVGRSGELREHLVASGALGTAEEPLPVRFAPVRGGEALPTVSVDGAPWRAVREALAGRDPALPNMAPWVRGVTVPWVAAARRWTR